jgi:hypothetical protein
MAIEDECDWKSRALAAESKLAALQATSGGGGGAQSQSQLIEDLNRKVQNGRYLVEYHEKAADDATQRQMLAEANAEDTSRRLARALERIDALHLRDKVASLTRDIEVTSRKIHDTKLVVQVVKAQYTKEKLACSGKPTALSRAQHSLQVHTEELQSQKKLLNLLLSRQKRQNELLSAVSEGNITTVRHLLTAGGGTCVNEPEGGGCEGAGLSPLHYASAAGHTEIVQCLLEHGGDVKNACGGLTPLLLAAMRGHKDIVEVILAAGAEIDFADEGGRTSLHMSAGRGHTDVVSKLLSWGASPSSMDGRGDTPLHLAAMCLRDGSETITAILCKHGADTAVKNASGDIPLDVALGLSNMPVVRTLRSAQELDRGNSA